MWVLRLVIALILLAVLIKDFREHMVNMVTAGLLLLASSLFMILQADIRSGLLVATILGVVWYFLPRLKCRQQKQSIMGDGDYPIVVALGLLFSWRALVVIWLGASLLLVAHSILVVLKQRRWKDEIPFAGYVSVVSIIHLFL